MTTHAKLSPSKRDRWAACPGSPREEAKYPEGDRNNAAAIDGTHSHTLLEECLKTGKPAKAYLGMMLADHDGSFTVEKDRCERVQVALDYVKERVVELGPACAVLSERKVSPKAVTEREDLDGTADIQFISVPAGVYEIADYKDGMNLVEPDCKQLRQYALAGLSEMSAADMSCIQTVRLTVIQPKLAAKGIKPVRSVDLDAGDFFLTETIALNKEAQATDDPNAPLIPGDHCKYCRHTACSARAEGALKAAGIEFPKVDVAQQSADKDSASLTDEQLREILEAAPLLRQMIENAEKEALRRLESGKAVSGLKVVRGRGSRVWAFDESEMAEKLKKFGLPKEVLWKTSLITPAQAEKVSWTKKDGTEKQLSERQLKLMKEEYIRHQDGKLTVALDSDPRPSVTIAAPEGMFPEVIPSWLS